MNYQNALRYCADYLNKRGIDEADFKALCLICHKAGIKNSEFLLNAQKEIDIEELIPLLNRLETGEPLQYIIGKWDFLESEFYVGKGVLIPRPETEELVELALKEAKRFQKPVIFDLCAGSGCIGISIAKKLENAKVFCVEKSEKAFYYLEKNAKGINNVKTILADINEKIELENADIIISNPPYVKTEDISSLQKELSFEPEMALDGGADGLDFYRIIKDKWSSKLNQNGVFLFEIGEEQGTDLKMMFSDFKEAEVLKDIYGKDRMLKIYK